jgi:uncharacterized protein YhfF
MRDVRGLVLDTGHRVLLLRAPDDTWHAPATPTRVGESPLAAIAAFARERLELELPPACGARPANDPNEFTFVVDPATRVDAAETIWAPLRDLEGMTRDGDLLWTLYVDSMLGGWSPPAHAGRAIDVFALGRGPRANAALAHMVAKGHKQGTAGWLAATEAMKNVVPSPGLVSVITDGFGYPVCAVETVRVDLVPFAEVPEEFAHVEGEGDHSLADWRARHRAEFEQQGAEVGLAFGEDAVVFLERFRVLRVLERSRG